MRSKLTRTLSMLAAAGVVAIAAAPTLRATPARADVETHVRPAACEIAEIACAGAEGAEARDARIARMHASIDALARGRDGRARELARIAEIGPRVAALREPLAAVFARVREAAAWVVQTRGGPSAERRAEALARLAEARLRWVDAAAYLEAPDAPRNVSLVLGCGPSLLRDEGWVSRDFREVVVCPGFLLLELERAGGDPQLAAEAAAFLIAHELGHVIERSANDLESERAADGWANEVLAAYVGARAAEGADPSDLTARALGSFCDLPDSALHGAGPERARRAASELWPLLCP